MLAGALRSVKSDLEAFAAKRGSLRDETAAPSALPGQFMLRDRLVSGSPSRAPDLSLATASLVFDGWQPLRTAEVVDASGKSIGLLVGDALDLEASVIIAERLTCRIPFEALNADRFVEQEIYRLGGSFLFILDVAGCRRVYLDADGTLSCVFDPALKRVGATAAAILSAEEYRSRFDLGLYRGLAIASDGWFPAGLTAHRGVERLLVNHYLDLDTWRQVRHWPCGDIPPANDPNAQCRLIAASTKAAIATLATADDPLACSLTAGNETRLLLAASKDLRDRITFVTIDAPETALDVHRARDLAQRFALKHSLLPLVVAERTARAEWHARTGHCNGGLNWRTHPSVWPLEPYAYLLIGLGGEVGRGFYWRATDQSDLAITADLLVARTGLAPLPRLRDAVARWLAGLPTRDPFQILDLFYLENRMGPWAFAQSYANPRVRQVSPMISRRVFEAMLSLPPEWRRSNRMMRETIAVSWPELLEAPINRWGDHRDLTSKLLRAVRRPQLIVRKLRRMVS